MSINRFFVFERRTGMKIQRILTNNALIVLNENDEEQIVCGRGIGFKKKTGDIINHEKIERVFILSRSEMTKQLEQLVSNIPIEYIETADEIIKMAKIELGKPLNGSILISLSDHLYAAVKRFKEGINISNSLMWEIRMYYDTEFNIGKSALIIVEQRLKEKLPDAEAAFIAMHFVNATLDDSSIPDIYEEASIISDISNIIKYHFNREINTEQAYYYRFVAHLKFFARRIFENKQESENNTDFLEVVKAKYNDSYRCMLKITQMIRKKYNYEMTDEEQLYIVIHIQRLLFN